MTKTEKLVNGTSHNLKKNYYCKNGFMSQNTKTITEKRLGRSKYVYWVLYIGIFNTIKNIF